MIAIVSMDHLTAHLRNAQPGSPVVVETRRIEGTVDRARRRIAGVLAAAADVVRPAQPKTLARRADSSCTA